MTKVSEFSDVNQTEEYNTSLQTQLNEKLIADGLSKITVSITPPTSPSVGDLWVDTSLI